MTHNKPFEGSLPDQENEPKLYESDTAQTFLTEADLAKRWHVSIKKLQSDRILGCSVQWVRLGRLVRYRLSDIIVWERENTRHNTSEI